MTDKQALELLEEFLKTDREMIGDTPKSDYDKFVMRQDEALEIAIEALRKQIPKEPDFIDKASDCRLCPNCHKYQVIDSKYNYCQRCGKKLDWNSVEKGSQ